MKKYPWILLIAIILSGSGAKAQRHFTDRYDQECVELYRTVDAYGNERMVVLVNPYGLSPKDRAILSRWNTFSRNQQSGITQQWADEGKQIELVDVDRRNDYDNQYQPRRNDCHRPQGQGGATVIVPVPIFIPKFGQHRNQQQSRNNGGQHRR